MAIALVQSTNGASGSTTTSRVVTVGSATVGGNFLVAAIHSGSQTAPTSVTDSAGNTWTKQTGSDGAGAASQRYTNIYTCPNALSVTTVTVASAVATVNMVTVFELSGVGGIRWSNSIYNGGLSACTGTSTAGDALIGCMGWSNGNTSATSNNPANGNTWTDSYTGGAVGTVYFTSSYFVGTTAGTRGPGYNTPGAVSYGISAISLYESVPPSFTWAHTVAQG